MKGLRARTDYILKHNLMMQKSYKVIMSFVFKTISIFIPINDKMILFSAHGRRYNDSPKAIYQKMINDSMYNGYEFVWALDDPNKYDIPGGSKVKMDTIKYFITALKAKYWITCVNIERGLHFKKKQTIYLNTWHGTPLKLIGNAVTGRKDFDFSSVDIFCAAGKYEKEIYKRDFNVLEDNILLSGLPRNDELYNVLDEQIANYKRLLNIPADKKVILYAPTWRDSTDNGKSYSIRPPINIDYWKNELQDEYVLLLRTHAYTNEVLGIEFDEFARDFSSYPDINQLLIVADILISDYSATIFDYSILERPIICFGYDYHEYMKDRGFYLDLEEEIPNGVIRTQEKVIEKILTLDYRNECKKTSDFKNKYLNTSGNATVQCIDLLFKSKKSGGC